MRTTAAGALAVLALAGCGGGQVDVAAPSPTPVAPALQAGTVADLLPQWTASEPPSPQELALRRAVLGALGTCAPRPTATVPAPDGVVLPPGAVVTRVLDQPGAQQFDGWVALTPVQVREHYLARAGVEVVASEDEVLESETQLEAGDSDVFVKARALCPTVSQLVGVVTPDTGKVAAPGTLQ